MRGWINEAYQWLQQCSIVSDYAIHWFGLELLCSILPTFICPFIQHPSTFIHLSFQHSFIHSFNHPSIHPSIYPSPIHPIFLHLSIQPQPIHPSIQLSSIQQSIFQTVIHPFIAILSCCIFLSGWHSHWQCPLQGVPQPRGASKGCPPTDSAWHHQPVCDRRGRQPHWGQPLQRGVERTAGGTGPARWGMGLVLFLPGTGEGLGIEDLERLQGGDWHFVSSGDRREVREKGIAERKVYCRRVCLLWGQTAAWCRGHWKRA